MQSANSSFMYQIHCCFARRAQLESHIRVGRLLTILKNKHSFAQIYSTLLLIS